MVFDGTGRGFTAGERHALDQYLRRYAEPEVGYTRQLEERYGAAIVLPLYAEAPESIERLTPELCANSEAPALVVAVVNAGPEAPAEAREANEALLTAWRQRARDRRWLALSDARPESSRVPGRAELLEMQHDGAVCAVLLIDCSSGDRGFPPKQGVGLARRIGFDVAVSLVAQGQIASRYIGSIDGDVLLPSGYLKALRRADHASAQAPSALLFPFEHVLGQDERTWRATQLVELSWRYYLLGLAWAGSPFAYHSLGSCLAIDAAYYARARGFPRRQAGEDFHLLAKLVKMAPLEVLQTPCIRIEARRSTRVPFGTGPAVERLVTSSEPEELGFYDPQVFVALRALLTSIRAMARGDEAPPSTFQAAPPMLEQELQAQVTAWRERIRPALASCPSEQHRLHRVFEIFDALATLQVIHAFERAGLSRRPWAEALVKAPFSDLQPSVSLAEALDWARRQEDLLPSVRRLHFLTLDPRKAH